MGFRLFTPLSYISLPCFLLILREKVLLIYRARPLIRTPILIKDKAILLLIAQYFTVIIVQVRFTGSISSTTASKTATTATFTATSIIIELLRYISVCFYCFFLDIPLRFLEFEQHILYYKFYFILFSYIQEDYYQWSKVLIKTRLENTSQYLVGYDQPYIDKFLLVKSNMLGVIIQGLELFLSRPSNIYQVVVY